MNLFFRSGNNSFRKETCFRENKAPDEWTQWMQSKNSNFESYLKISYFLFFILRKILPFFPLSLILFILNYILAKCVVSIPRWNLYLWYRTNTIIIVICLQRIFIQKNKICIHKEMFTICLNHSLRKQYRKFALTVSPIKGVRPLKLHMIGGLQFWRSRECEVPCHYYYS